MNGNDAFRQALKHILGNGKPVKTRNENTLRSRNLMYTFTSTPLVSIRRTAWKNALREFEWFMSGSSNINDLHEKVHPWWKPWADETGEIKNNYSKQFRKFVGLQQVVDYYDDADTEDDLYGDTQHITHESDPEDYGFDQIEVFKHGIKEHPFSRRNLITTWNTSDMQAEGTPITNCHGTVIQAFVEPDDNSLHLTMYQRSCDMVLGVPHNYIQYWAFLMWLAHHGGRKVGTFTWIGGDCHIYPDHMDMAKRIVQGGGAASAAPQLVYTPTSEDFKADDFSLDGEYQPLIKESLKMTV